MPFLSGKQAFLRILKEEGVELMFGNPGTTELPLMDGLAREPGIRYILALQESVAVAMADGYAQASGKLAVVNLHVAVREWKDDIVFLRKILPGRSDRSYGIQVARLAGLPVGVIDRARQILAALERDELTRGGRPSVSGTPDEPQQQLALFRATPADDGLRARLSAIDVDRMTPIEALTTLAELRKEALG